MPPGPFQFVVWDAEDIFDENGSSGPFNQDGGRGNDGAWVEPRFRANQNERRYDISRLWHALRRNPDFMLRFADRVYRHCFNDGALTVSASRVRWRALTDRLRVAIPAEYARWGDTRTVFDEPTRTPALWEADVTRVHAMMAGNVNRFINALRREGFYPALDPPVITPFGGIVAGGTVVRVENPNDAGQVVFTTNGDDPRSGGEAGPVRIDGPTRVKARVRRGDSWSAVAEAVFYVRQDVSGLRLTEVMYHPLDAGPVGGADFEFLEFKNVGDTPIDLSGATFADGVRARAPVGVRVAPGGFALFVADTARFAERYPGIPVAAEFTGALSNSGERLALADPAGAEILAIEYDDDAPWPVAADRAGRSLVPRHPDENPDLDDAGNWLASAEVGGSPGRDDPASLGGEPPPPRPDAGVEMDAAPPPEPIILPGWTAFNDLSWGEGQRRQGLTRITTAAGEGTPPDGATGELATTDDAPTGIALAVVGGAWEGAVHATQGAAAAAGTDAARDFGAAVDTVGVISYGEPIVLTLTGLDPERTYRITVFGNRDRPQYADRISRFVLEGADAFVNASSVGAGFAGPDDPATIIVCGHNTETGYVARFVDVRAGEDGAVAVRIEDGGSAAPPKQYVNAVRVDLDELRIDPPPRPDAGPPGDPDAGVIGDGGSALDTGRPTRDGRPPVGDHEGRSATIQRGEGCATAPESSAPPWWVALCLFVCRRRSVRRSPGDRRYRRTGRRRH